MHRRRSPDEGTRSNAVFRTNHVSGHHVGEEVKQRVPEEPLIASLRIEYGTEHSQRDTSLLRPATDVAACRQRRQGRTVFEIEVIGDIDIMKSTQRSHMDTHSPNLTFETVHGSKLHTVHERRKTAPTSCHRRKDRQASRRAQTHRPGPWLGTARRRRLRG